MKSKNTLLIIDKDASTRDRLNMLLRSSYEVYPAQDGKEALEIIYNKNIDIVILDPHSKATKGIALVRAIKSYDSAIEVIVVTGDTALKTAIEALHYGVFDYLIKPFNMTEIISVVDAAAKKRNLNIKLKSIFQELNTLSSAKKQASAPSLLSNDEILTNIARKICYQYFEKGQDERNYSEYLRFVRTLSSTLESKDPYTHGHSERVSYYSALIGSRLPLEDESEEELRIAAYLHDIGKIGVSDSLVCKENGLTDEEWCMIKKHPEMGVNLISSLNTSHNIISYVRHHHEHFDGKGYPYGLAGEDIPLGGRIIAVADAYDAMTSTRSYRRAFLPREAQGELQKCASTQFDPQLVEIFVKAVQEDELPQINAGEFSDEST